MTLSEECAIADRLEDVYYRETDKIEHNDGLDEKEKMKMLLMWDAIREVGILILAYIYVWGIFETREEKE